MASRGGMSASAAGGGGGGGGSARRFDAPTSGPSKEEIDRMVERAAEEENLDLAGVKRLAANLERKMRKNVQDRDKHANDPEKFLDSEVDLDEELHRLQVLTTVPEHYYDLAKNTSLIPTLLSLLSHENSDIVCSVLGLLNELSDAEVISEDPTGRAEAVIEVLGENSVLQHLITAMLRLNAEVGEEAAALMSAMGILENIDEIDPEIIPADASSYQALVDFLLCHITRVAPNESSLFPQHKVYASEILGILLHNDVELQKSLGGKKVHKSGEPLQPTTDPKDTFNAIHALLKCLSGYRKKDDPSLEEVEYAENVFDCLCKCLLHKHNRELFLKADGIQLMIILIKRRKSKAKDAKNAAKRRALSQLNRLMRESAMRVLSFAVQGSVPGCNTLVDANGLGALFAMYMLRPKTGNETSTELSGQILSILHHLLMLLNDERKTRLLRKFVENDFEKTERLVEFYIKFNQKLKAFDHRIAMAGHRPASFIDPDREMDDDELFVERLGNGLYELQLVSAIMAAICTKSRKILERTEGQLKLNGLTVNDVRTIIQGEFLRNIGSSGGGEEPKDDSTAANATTTTTALVSEEELKQQKRYLEKLFTDFRPEAELQKDKDRKRAAEEFDLATAAAAGTSSSSSSGAASATKEDTHVKEEAEEKDVSGGSGGMLKTEKADGTRTHHHHNRENDDAADANSGNNKEGEPRRRSRSRSGSRSSSASASSPPFSQSSRSRSGSRSSAAGSWGGGEDEEKKPAKKRKRSPNENDDENSDDDDGARRPTAAKKPSAARGGVGVGSNPSSSRAKEEKDDRDARKRRRDSRDRD